MLIRTRLSLLAILIVTSALGGFSWTVFQATRSGVLVEIQRDVVSRAHAIAESVTVGAEGRPEAPSLDVFTTPDTYIQLTAADGRVLAGSDNLHGRRLPFLRAAFDAGRVSEDEVGDVPVVVFASPVHLEDELAGYVVVGRSPGPLYQVLHRLRGVLVVGGGLVLVLTGVVVWLTVRGAMNPLTRLATAATQITHSQDHSGRVRATRRSDEIGQLATTINGMLEALEKIHRELEEASETQRRFLVDVSHELRTPLTIILSSLELVDRLAGSDPEFHERALADVRAEAERMARMVTRLLIMARAGASAKAADQPLLIGDVVADLCRQWTAQGDHARVVCCGFESLEDAVVHGNEDYLRQLFLILLDNAFKFTPDSGVVEVRGELSGDAAEISVTDTGVGIAPEDLPHIFDRFYQARNGHGREGTGLGLSIARHIAEQHGGKVEVESALGQGSRFTVTLPLME